MKRKARAATSGKQPPKRAELAIRSVRVEASGGPELIGKVLGAFLGPFLSGFVEGVAGDAVARAQQELGAKVPAAPPAAMCRCGHQRGDHVAFENGKPSTACAGFVEVERLAFVSRSSMRSPTERRRLRCSCSAFEAAR